MKYLFLLLLIYYEINLFSDTFGKILGSKILICIVDVATATATITETDRTNLNIVQYAKMYGYSL